MKQVLAPAIVLSAFALLSSAASAAITSSVTASSTGFLITAWPTAFTTASVANPSTYASAENNYGGGPTFSLAESFTNTATGKLTHAQIQVTGTPQTPLTVNIYSAANNLANNSVATYTPGTDATLLASASVTSTNTYLTQGDNVAVLDFAFTGTDSPTLLAGSQYIFEIASTSASVNALLLYRNGADATDYVGGQAFRARGALNGNAKRDFALAITTAVPEPTSVVTLAAAGVAALVRHRKA